MTSYDSRMHLYREIDEQDETTNEIHEKILVELFNGRKPTLDDLDKIGALQADPITTWATVKATQLFAESNTQPVYEYRYNHVSAFTLIEILLGGTAKFVVRVGD